MDANGGISLKQSSGNYDLYGLRGYPGFLPTSTVPLWTSGDPEHPLTLNDLAGATFAAHTAGSAMMPSIDEIYAYNRNITRNAQGDVTSIIVEFQTYDDGYVKCVVAELTENNGVIYGKAIRRCYVLTTADLFLGYRMCRTDGTYTSSHDTSIATSTSGASYGIYGLTAMVETPEREFTLDANRSWSEFTGGVPLNDAAMTVRVKVTGNNPVLTFDENVNIGKLIIENGRGDGASTNSLAVAGGASVAVGELALGETVRTEVPSALASVATVSLGAGARAVYAGDASGRVTFTSSASSFGGGTNPCGGADKISLVRMRNAATCVTNSTEMLSELHMNIASGTLRNDHLPIGGNLKLVKEGSGTYVSGMVQTYSGGTLVAGGTAQPPDGTGANATYSGTKYRAFGTGVLTVSEGAVFDLRGNYDYTYIALDGGTLRNSGFHMTQTSWGGASLVALTKDSYIDMKTKIVFGTGIDAVDLNGKTLFMNATPGAVLTVRCQSIENGTISYSGGGWLDVSCRDMSGVRLEVASSFNLVGNVEIVDYTSSYLLSNYDGATGNNGSGVIGVAGVFKPLTDYWHACELHGGATIDLSARTSELSAVSFFSKGAKNLAFTEGARMNVKLGTRPVSAGERIIGWTEDTKPANVGTVKFVRGDADRNYGFVVKDDGLYITKGMMVIVR